MAEAKMTQNNVNGAGVVSQSFSLVNTPGF